MQATVKFEDGLWIGNRIKAQNGLQRIRTIHEVLPGVVCTSRFFWGLTEYQSAWVHIPAWCRAMQWVQFLAAAVLGFDLTSGSMKCLYPGHTYMIF